MHTPRARSVVLVGRTVLGEPLKAPVEKSEKGNEMIAVGIIRCGYIGGTFKVLA